MAGEGGVVQVPLKETFFSMAVLCTWEGCFLFLFQILKKKKKGENKHHQDSRWLDGGEG